MHFNNLATSDLFLFDSSIFPHVYKHAPCIINGLNVKDFRCVPKYQVS